MGRRSPRRPWCVCARSKTWEGSKIAPWEILTPPFLLHKEVHTAMTYMPWSDSGDGAWRIDRHIYLQTSWVWCRSSTVSKPVTWHRHSWMRRQVPMALKHRDSRYGHASVNKTHALRTPVLPHGPQRAAGRSPTRRGTSMAECLPLMWGRGTRLHQRDRMSWNA